MEFASKQAVSQGFTAVAKKFESQNAQLAEAARQLKGLSNQFRRMIQSGYFSKGRDEVIHTCWEDADQARQFGYLVMKALGRHVWDERAMGEAVPSEGGFLVPTVLSERIIDLLGKYGKFRKNTTVLPAQSGEIIVPKIETDLTVYCPGEGGTITPSDVVFSQVRLLPKTWAVLCKVSNELNEDAAGAIGEILGISIIRSMAKQEDRVGFLGDGTETYFGMKGIVGSLLAISDTISEIAGLQVASGNAWSEITMADFDALESLLPEGYDEDAKYYCSKTFYHTVMKKLARNAGDAGIYEILSPTKSKYFNGYEVEFVSSMPKTEANSQICCILGDLRAGSYLADRGYLWIQSSPHVYFTNNQIGVRGIERIDTKIFGVGDTTNPGPIVALITAAA